MPVVWINDVGPAPHSNRLITASIEEPQPGAKRDLYSFDIGGLVVTEGVPVTVVEVRQQGRLVLEVPAVPVPPEASNQAPINGLAHRFGGTVNATEIRATFELHLHARSELGAPIPVGQIRGTRHKLPSNPEPHIQPALVTTLGRSGSKWLVWLLSQHPQNVALNPLIFEARAATYWISVFRSLSNPRSFLRQIHNEGWEEHWWLGRHDVDLPAPLAPDLSRWLGRDSVESLASACQARIESFYEQVGTTLGRPNPKYFVEKFLLDPVTIGLVNEMYPSAKEVILVRDFRDRLSSVLAWNARKGQDGFGREAFSTDADFVTSRLRTEAASLHRHWRERKDKAHLVRYEDLVRAPRRTLIDLLRFLDVDSSGEAADATLDRASRKTTLLDAHRTVNQPLASIGRWRHDLTPELAELCNEVLEPMLGEFGYLSEPEGKLSETGL